MLAIPLVLLVRIHDSPDRLATFCCENADIVSTLTVAALPGMVCGLSCVPPNPIGGCPMSGTICPVFGTENTRSISQWDSQGVAAAPKVAEHGARAAVGQIVAL